MVILKVCLEKIDFEKKTVDDKKHEKFPVKMSMVNEYRAFSSGNVVSIICCSDVARSYHVYFYHGLFFLL